MRQPRLQVSSGVCVFAQAIIRSQTVLDPWPPQPLVNVPNLDRSTIRIVEGSVDVCEKMLRQICEAHINELVLYLAAMPRAITLNLRGVLRVPCSGCSLYLKGTIRIVMTVGFSSTEFSLYSSGKLAPAGTAHHARMHPCRALHSLAIAPLDLEEIAM